MERPSRSRRKWTPGLPQRARKHPFYRLRRWHYQSILPARSSASASTTETTRRNRARSFPKAPLLFAKWGNTLIGAGEPIILPPESEEVDYEAELGVVIGARTRRASERDALDAVRGYLCLNDVSARDLQFADRQWTRGKSPDSFCPIGPRLVPREEIEDPQALKIRCILNGQTMQDSSTSQMIFSVAEIIAHVSRLITLQPGDLIATGTPAGVGVFRDPKVLLKDGDEVTVEVEGLGALTNPVRRES